MKKNVWIMNHYATEMFENEGGRHYWFAENLVKSGYNPTIFCASTFHNSNKQIIIGKKKYKVQNKNEIPFVHIKTSEYNGNGIDRIKNMVDFYRNTISIASDYAKKNEKPDIILASSVHPLTLVAGIKIAKKFDIPCICEVRDLWPESIVAYGALKRNSFLARILYKGEKWIYRKADSIIMTWAGGKQYIKNQGWENEINLNKITHINNGVTINYFDKNKSENKIIDKDLDNKDYKNLVYTGSIRNVNNIGLLLDVAKIIHKEDKSIRFLIYGSGDEKKYLEQRCKKENIDNVIFKGRVEKRMIPSILSKSYINILHNSSTSLNKYGQSQNKLFEYLASGKPIIQTYTTGYSILEKYNCGYMVKNQNSKEIADTVLEACTSHEKNKKMGKNARKAAYNYDFERLTNKLIKVIEQT